MGAVDELTVGLATRMATLMTLMADRTINALTAGQIAEKPVE